MMWACWLALVACFVVSTRETSSQLDKVKCAECPKTPVFSLGKQECSEHRAWADTGASDAGRRRVLGAILGSYPILASSPSRATANIPDEPDFACLSDLPPVPLDSIRVYACRHGQTENNRLRLVQGARVDPPLNENGIKQAKRLGEALIRASVPPTAIYHSPLLRAKETAAVAAAQWKPSAPPTSVLDSVREIDFGPTSDGTSVKQTKRLMVATYSRWAIGDLDARMASEGESGREVRIRSMNHNATFCIAVLKQLIFKLQVLVRVEQAMQDILELSRGSDARSVAVISHSSFLRTLLATLQNISLVNVASIDIENASVSVLDVKKSSERVKLGRTSPVFGGWLSRADANFGIEYPAAAVLRVNENRHLGSYSRKALMLT